MFLIFRFRRSQGILSTPGKVRPRTAPKTDLDSFVVDALRREIMNTYCNKEIPTSKRLLKFLVDEFDYSGSLSSLQRLLKKMGFRWKTQNNRKLLLERADVVAARRSYLREMKKNRISTQPLDVIYTDETFLHKTETVSKTWQLQKPSASEASACGIKVPVGKGPRFIIVHAGGEKGWVEDAQLLWRSDNPVSADYHGDMDANKYLQWFEELCQKLENPSIIVIDNASYHSTLKDKVPNTAWRKGDIKNWLDGKRIESPESALKAELLVLVKINPQKKTYILDELALSHGHQVLRLPPYHCDLNPIELIWGQCKTYVRQNNKEFTLAAVQRLWQEAVDGITAERWAKTVKHVQKLEEAYWHKDGVVEVEIEPLIINTGGSSSESESGLSGDSDCVDDLGATPIRW